MAKRATIGDIAAASGVSVATVDRVLNGRLPVREETAARVYEAARRLGYHASGLLRHRLAEDTDRYRLGFLLQKPRQAFYQNFAREIETATAATRDFGCALQLEYLDSQSPPDVAARLLAIGARNQAVAVVAVDHPVITSAVEELRTSGVPVFALLSDFAAGSRETYLGVDNQKAGRTAAWMIARTAPRRGKVAVLIGNHRFHGHELRELGLRSYFREHAPEFELVDTMVNLEDQGVAHETTLHLLRRHPDVVGLYVAGGGSEGVVAALREQDMAGRISVVCSELTPLSRSALFDGVITMTISTPLPSLAREAVTHMAAAIRNGPSDTPGQVFLPFEINIAESI